MGEELTSVVLRILRGEDDVASINEILLVLIPKVERLMIRANIDQ